MFENFSVLRFKRQFDVHTTSFQRYERRDNVVCVQGLFIFAWKYCNFIIIPLFFFFFESSTDVIL